jgi:acetyl esterase/lipase
MCGVEEAVVKAGRAGAAALLAGAVAAASMRRLRAVQELPRELRGPLVYLPISIGDPLSLRLVRLIDRQLPLVPGVQLGHTTVPGLESDPPVPVVIYRPTGHGERGASGALLWIHAGGLIAGRPDEAHDFCSRVAAELGVLVVSVGYRLAPEHPFPAALDDCTVVLQWLHDQAASLGVDRSRIAVGGASAGGGLAAALCQRAHDEGRVPVAFQFLLYPMLDDRTVLRSDAGGRGRFIWTPRSNRFAWASYLGHPAGQPDEPPYAVPARRTDLSGLPPAWIGVGDLDLFHDEDVDYASRLQDAGVECELDVVPGMYHGTEIAAPSAAISTRFRDRMVASLQGALGSA